MNFTLRDSLSHKLISTRTRENINATSVVALLVAIREKHPVGAISLVMDNARCQRCQPMVEHAAQREVELLFQPPCIPSRRCRNNAAGKGGGLHAAAF